MSDAHLTLSSGGSLEGQSIGAPVSSSGELVFTTGMVGYSEALTDPSYYGQILVFAYPLIGNYGVPSPPESDGWISEGFESHRIWASGVVVTVSNPDSFHWNSVQTFSAWLKDQGVPGLMGLDTRHLVRTIRSSTETILGRIENSAGPNSQFFDPSGHNLLPSVSTGTRRILGKGSKRLAVIDCGVKWNILRRLVSLGCEVELLPWDEDLSRVDCSGWVLSNGPGNPKQTGNLIPRIRLLLEQNRPILGICLGHQILALASGAETSRLPYGHRSHNQPVLLVGTRRGYITSQNHGYVVDAGSLAEGWEPWFTNLNDQSLEGIRHRSKPFRSVQFHPEAAGGPRDTAWILDEFVQEVKR